MSEGDVCRHCGSYRESHVKPQMEHPCVQVTIRNCPGFELWNPVTEKSPPFRQRNESRAAGQQSQEVNHVL